MADPGGSTSGADRDDPPATPRISVCVPMYDNSATIERCLRSILDQEGADFEIVVVDDDSADDSVAIASTLLRPGDRLVRNLPRLGLNGNHNRCIELARGECVQFVHGDDWLLPAALRTLVLSFDDPTVGVAFAPRQVNTDDRRWMKRYGTPHTRFRKLGERNRGSDLVGQIAKRGAHGNWIGEPTSVMFRRQTALDVGGLRSDIHLMVDSDFWLRLMLRSDVCFVPQKLSVRSHTPSTATAQIVGAKKDWLDRLRILTWLRVAPGSTARIRRFATAWWVSEWLRLLMETALLGPDRGTRLKTLVHAPRTELETARNLAATRGGSGVGTAD